MNWLNCLIQRVLISSIESIRSQSLVVYPRSPYGASSVFTSSLMTLTRGWSELSASLQATKKMGGVVGYTRWLCCHLDGPQQAGEIGKQESYKVQQREIPVPVPKEEYSGTSVQAEAQLPGKQLAEDTLKMDESDMSQ